MQELTFWDSNSLQGLTYTGFSSLNILFKTAPVSCYLKANVSLDKFTWTKETISKPTSSGNVSWKAFFILISTSVSLNSFQNSKALIMWPFSCKHNLLTFTRDFLVIWSCWQNSPLENRLEPQLTFLFFSFSSCCFLVLVLTVCLLIWKVVPHCVQWRLVLRQGWGSISWRW